MGAVTLGLVVGGWQLVACGSLIGGQLLPADGWWLALGVWWLVDGGCLLVALAGGRWLLGGCVGNPGGGSYLGTVHCATSCSKSRSPQHKCSGSTDCTIGVTVATCKVDATKITHEFQRVPDLFVNRWLRHTALEIS